MKIGYARVSTKDQNLSMQLDALKEAGCEQIFKEKISGASIERKELDNLVGQLRKGDIIVVWKLDRLARSLKDLLRLVNEFQEKGVGFISLNDPIDTTTPQGRLVFTLFGALAEFEREIIKERTKAGLESARARGRKGGRPPGLSKEASYKASAAVEMYIKRMPVNEIAKSLGISKTTLYKYLGYKGVGLYKVNIA